MVGISVGIDVVGFFEGLVVGWDTVGDKDGEVDGPWVGWETVGDWLGEVEGLVVWGYWDGMVVVGVVDGETEGVVLGDTVGFVVFPGTYTKNYNSMCINSTRINNFEKMQRQNPDSI